jgi:hypothetical protein
VKDPKPEPVPEEIRKSCFIVEIIWKNEKPKYELYQTLEKAKAIREVYLKYDSVAHAIAYQAIEVL